MFDYAEFERYNEEDALRNNTLFKRQWEFMTKAIVHKLFHVTKENLKNLSESEYKKTFNRYKKTIDDFSEDLVVISNKCNEHKIFTGLYTEFKENFFKYKGFRAATGAYFSDVIEPFINNAKFAANLTQQDKDFCSQNKCASLKKQAEIFLMAQIEILKLGNDIWLDIGAGHFLESALDLTGLDKRNIQEETTEMTNSLLGLNFSGSILEFPNYLSNVFFRRDFNIKKEDTSPKIHTFQTDNCSEISNYMFQKELLCKCPNS